MEKKTEFIKWEPKWLKEGPKQSYPGSPFSYVFLLLDPRDHTVRFVTSSPEPEVRLERYCNGAGLVLGGMIGWMGDLWQLQLKPEIVIVSRVLRIKEASAVQRWIAYLWTKGRIYNPFPTRRRGESQGFIDPETGLVTFASRH